MTYVTLDQAAASIVHRLTRAPVKLRTLQRWVQQHPDVADKRLVKGKRQTHYLAEADLQVLVRYYPEYEWQPTGTLLSPVRSLALKVQQFEEDIANLRALILNELARRQAGEMDLDHAQRALMNRDMPVASATDQATDSPPLVASQAPHRTFRPKTPKPTLTPAEDRPPQLPDGWISYSAVCSAHHIDKRTVDQYLPKLYGVEGRSILHKGPYRLSNTTVEWALDDAQQRWLIAVFKAHTQFKGFWECGNPTCPCHTVEPTVAAFPPPGLQPAAAPQAASEFEALTSSDMLAVEAERAGEDPE